MYRLPSTVSQGRLGARPRLTISSQSSMLVDRNGDRGAQGDVIVLEEAAYCDPVSSQVGDAESDRIDIFVTPTFPT